MLQAHLSRFLSHFHWSLLAPGQVCHEHLSPLRVSAFTIFLSGTCTWAGGRVQSQRAKITLSI